ncbi:putative phosphoesterase [Clostridium punense]|uniref:Phosphoesterase n=1 Tax=Clostridium punense TaxID=1054297 RepID=A0ABS4K372_9CLOT|nr:metallophosphoesterase [Clostridium sp. BL8]EQB90017.1 hypothetical protein M918_01935 [Clostridium sp. BL8]MBP2022218.1 putative phosphoesterase [Clostridium punense]
MKIGVLSDSHGNVTSIERAIKALEECNIIYHLGDYIRDLKLIKDRLGLPMIAIRGNCDLHSEGIKEVVERVEGVNIFLTHGDRYDVKFNLFKLRYKAMETNSSLVLYGHTHIGKIEKEEGIYYVNPGSVAEPRGSSKATIAIIEINEGVIKPELVEI